MKSQNIGLSYSGAFLDCSEVLAVAKKSEKKKGKKKNRKGRKGNEEEGNTPLFVISAAAGMMIRSAHLVSQCG